MAVNGVTTSAGISTASYESVSFSAEIKKTETTVAAATDAAVYEKSSDDEKAVTNQIKNRNVDYETIEKLKADAEERTASLRGLVEKMLLKQGATIDLASGIIPEKGLADFYRSLEVDEETQKKAQEDISEDGYWGVEQTSDRILSFAQALAGNDPEAAASMLEAIKQGFEEAADAWGEDLPGLSQDTMKATLEKVNSWIESLKGASSENEAAPASNSTASVGYAKQTTTSIKISATYTRAEAATMSYAKQQELSDVKKLDTGDNS